MSTPYLLFLNGYALLLVAASLLVLTQTGQEFMLRTIERAGHEFGVGPWGLLYGFEHEAPASVLTAAERATLAEAYIAEAEAETLRGARLSLWILIAGCVACAVAAIIIIGVFPPLVISGAWTYGAYRRAAMLVVYGTAAGGLVMGAGLVIWLFGRTTRLNCTDECAIVRDLILAAREDALPADVSAEIAGGTYPRLQRMLGHASP